MMKKQSMKKNFSIILVLLSFLSCVLKAQDIDKIINTPPSPPRLVNDYANVLTSDQAASLEQKLVDFDKATSNQIAVVLVQSLNGRDIGDAATELGRKWGVGQKNNNNGVVLLVAIADRKLNISPGDGLEKSLPDLVCQQIIETAIKPNFRGQDYYRGLDEGTDAIMQATKGEFKAPQGYYKNKGISAGRVILIIIIIIIVLSLMSGGGRGGSFMSRRGYRGFNGPVIFPGGWSGGGGGWSGGGGGGGGFGGFGGGGFGGGGSSGSW